MRSRHQQHHSGDDSEEGEDDQTETIQNHGSELPVTLSAARIIITPDLVSDQPQLLQYQRQFSHCGGGQWTQLLLVEWQLTGRPETLSIVSKKVISVKEGVIFCKMHF